VPDVSLCIPVHNSAPFLDELFGCLRHLDPPPAEIVFLDDASNDDSATRVERFIAETRAGPPMRLLRNERNMGIAAAYNRLAREARGDWVQLLDADDLLVERDFYASVRPELRRNFDIVVTGLRSNSRLLDWCARSLSWMVPRRPPTWFPLLGSFATRAGVIYRRARLMSVAFPDPSWPGSDVIHLLQLRTTGACRFLARRHVFYRVHPDSSSSRQRDYSPYRCSLAQFSRPIRLVHAIDLWLRGIGQRWVR